MTIPGLNRGAGIQLRAGTKSSPYGTAYVLILESLIIDEKAFLIYQWIPRSSYI
jgi:hypothetical protein